MTFISINALKERLNVSLIQIVRNPNTGKLFAETGKGKFKVQASLDTALPVKFMYDSEETFNEGCITNVKETNNVICEL